MLRHRRIGGSISASAAHLKKDAEKAHQLRSRLVTHPQRTSEGTPPVAILPAALLLTFLSILQEELPVDPISRCTIRR